MNARVQLAFLMAVVVIHAETIDRIAVTVGSHVITESEIIRYARVAAFLDEKTPNLSGAGKRAAAERLIDQYLILEDATDLRAPVPPPADVEALLGPLKARHDSPAEFQSALKSASITEADVRQHLASGLRMMRYTDLRFRPEVQFTDEELEAFATSIRAGRGGSQIAQNRAPERPDGTATAAAAGATGIPSPGLGENRDEVEKLFIDQRVMQAMDRWLEMVRHDATIVFRSAVFQ